MAEIAPFRGSRYNHQSVDLDAVVSPPYDVLTPDDVRDLRARSPYNAIHVDLPVSAGESNGGAYVRAGAAFRHWHDEGVVVRDDTPSLYLVEQAFRDPDGFERLRRGVVARLRLTAFTDGVVFPHEKTHAGPIDDRLKLVRATHATLSQVFMLYADEGGTVTAALAAAADDAGASGSATLQTAHDRDGNTHRVTPIGGERAAHVCDLLLDEKLIIADGHHRYATAVHYRDERRAVGDASADWLMVYLCSASDPGLTVFPTHRLVKGIEVPPMSSVIERLRPHFTVFPERGGDAASCESLAAHLRTFADRGKVFGLYFPREGACCTVELRDPSSLGGLIDEGFSPESSRLAVTILHYLILRDALGIDPAATEGHIDYMTDPAEAFSKLSSGAYTLGAFINPTQVGDVRAVAERGETMPHKSTYFYPKLLTGLVFDQLGDS